MIQISMGVAHDTDTTLLLCVAIEVGLVIQFSTEVAHDNSHDTNTTLIRSVAVEVGLGIQLSIHAM